MCYLKRISFIISVLLLPSIKTDSQSTIAQENHKTIPATKIDNLLNGTSPLPNRRLYTGRSQLFQKFNQEYHKSFQRLKQNKEKYLDTRANNTKPFYIRQRGPITYTLSRNYKFPGVVRQGEGAGPGRDGDNDKPPADDDDEDGEKKEATAAPKATEVLGGERGTPRNEAAGAATRFTTRTTTTRRRRRTTPPRKSFVEDCDYLAYYCLKAYDTGKVCARTLYFIHMTFKNYCMVDYVNCMERYDIWQIAHMGECFELKILTEYLHYPYNDDYFLDNYYIVEDM